MNIEVHTQAQLDKAFKNRKSTDVVVCLGGTWGHPLVLWDSSHAVLWGSSHAVLRGSSHAELRGSSYAELRDSSHAVLWGSSHAVLWGSSHAVLRGSSHAVLWDSSHAVLWDSSHAVGSNYTAIHRMPNHRGTAKGGVIIEIPLVTTAAEWCDYYGVTFRRGMAILFKALDDDYSTDAARSAGIFYTPGSKPKAPDWDGGKRECGGGLHFSPHPSLARNFNESATRYVACPVRLSEIVVHKDPQHPSKVKAPRVAGKVYEVDEWGERLRRTTLPPEAA